MNTVEAQHSQSEPETDKEPVIRFGNQKVDNIFLKFRDTSEWDVKKGQDETKYSHIVVTKDCTEVCLTFYMNDGKYMTEQVFIPLTNVSTFIIKYKKGHHA